MASVILEQLQTFGPDRCRRLSYEEAARYTADLAASHYENFSVVTGLLPRRLHEDFANVYAFCRWADDLGDEVGDPAKSLELLAWWKRELAGCYAGEPRHPVFVALDRTIRRHDVPAKPFEDLIDAFEQDQRVHRYRDWEQVVGYCMRSADPVGRLVLYLCGYRDAERQRLSDFTCTGLQLVNFWQDVRRDILERDRIYVPGDALESAGLSHDRMVEHVRGTRLFTGEEREAMRGVIRGLLERTEPLFGEGRGLWPRVDREVRVPIQLFTMGGEAVARGIRRVSYDTIDRRPIVGKLTKLRLIGRALLGRATAGMLGPGQGGGVVKEDRA